MTESSVASLPLEILTCMHHGINIMTYRVHTTILHGVLTASSILIVQVHMILLVVHDTLTTTNLGKILLV